MRRVAVALLLAGALLAAGCGGDDDGAETPPQQQAAPGLAGAWVLREGLDVDGWERIAPTVKFGDRVITGVAGCNSFSVSFTLRDQQIALSDVARTTVRCQPVERRVEAAFVKQLGRTASFSVQDGELVLADEAGQELLRFGKA